MRCSYCKENCKSLSPVAYSVRNLSTHLIDDLLCHWTNCDLSLYIMWVNQNNLIIPLSTLHHWKNPAVTTHTHTPPLVRDPCHSPLITSAVYEGIYHLNIAVTVVTRKEGTFIPWVVAGEIIGLTWWWQAIDPVYGLFFFFYTEFASNATQFPMLNQIHFYNT